MDTSPNAWLVFTSSLPGRPASTPRVRLWRALKESGAASLRDGVVLLPATDIHREKLQALAEQLKSEGGAAWLLELPAQPPETEQRLRAVFDRSDAYQDVLARLATLRSELPRLDEPAARRRLRQVEHALESITHTDFFPGELQARTRETLAELIDLTNRRFSPQEPSRGSGEVLRLDGRDYVDRLWATRRHLWVDRVASAWLIRQFIDSKARFLWLEAPAGCPADALGFDFDGAEFTHVGERVTFEVLLASFGLESDPGLMQLGRLVHYLDVGGEPVAEAAGFEAVLAGLRETTVDDNDLLAATTPVLDALYRRFSRTER
jgi:hypothetical protein